MKFERVLCPVDFSDSSAAALRIAGRLSKALPSELTVLHAQRREFPLYFTAAQTQELEAQLSQSHQASRKDFEDFVARNLPDDLPRSNRLVEEEPVAAILRTSSELNTNLIVMGTHGRTGWSRFRLGSVMEGVLRQAGVPVLAVGPTVASAAGSGIPADILCPIDFDPLSQAALEAGCLLARATGARMTLLHVLERQPEANNGLKSIEDRLREWAGAKMSEPCSLRQIVRHGNVAQTIAEEAKRTGSGLLVVGARPRITLGSIMFGSTTEALARTAPCPVLVVPSAHAGHQESPAKQSRGKEQQL